MPFYLRHSHLFQHGTTEDLAMISDEDRLDMYENARRAYENPKRVSTEAFITSVIGVFAIGIVCGLWCLFNWLFGTL